MSYRDDLAAAQARADTAERRARDLQKRVDELERGQTDASDDVPAVEIPEPFEVIREGDALRIRWRWFRPSEHLPLLVFCIIWDVAMIGWYTSAFRGDAAWPAFVLPIAHLAVGVGLTFATVAGLLNRTTVSARPDELTIRHAPVWWRGNATLRRAGVLQLYVRKADGASERAATYELYARVAGGRDRRLIRGLPLSAQARFLERELERYFGIRDRAVDGEERDD